MINQGGSVADDNKRITTWTIVKAFFSIIALAAMFYSFNAYIDNKIEKRLNDPAVSKRIAKQVRPFTIFSGTGTIIIDNGAMEYLANLTIKNSGASRAGTIKKNLLKR